MRLDLRRKKDAEGESCSARSVTEKYFNKIPSYQQSSRISPSAFHPLIEEQRDEPWVVPQITASQATRL